MLSGKFKHLEGVDLRWPWLFFESLMCLLYHRHLSLTPKERDMKDSKQELLTPYAGRLEAEQRAALLGQKGMVIWFTGLSGSGKSTVAHGLEERLLRRGQRTTVLDGDSVRLGLCEGLDFSAEGRAENLRRVAHVARLMCDAGLIVLCAFVSPLRSQRSRVRSIIGHRRFELVYMNADLDLCEQRDPKGLYVRARRGEISNFTGISSPYEVPTDEEGFALDAALATERALDRLDDVFGLLPKDS